MELNLLQWSHPQKFSPETKFHSVSLFADLKMQMEKAEKRVWLTDQNETKDSVSLLTDNVTIENKPDQPRLHMTRTQTLSQSFCICFHMMKPQILSQTS